MVIPVVKTIWIVTGSLTLLAVFAMVMGYPELAGVATGGLAGWIGGNQNGKRSDD